MSLAERSVLPLCLPQVPQHLESCSTLQQEPTLPSLTRTEGAAQPLSTGPGLNVVTGQ